jgi:hypothetical protein
LGSFEPINGSALPLNQGDQACSALQPLTSADEAEAVSCSSAVTLPTDPSSAPIPDFYGLCQTQECRSVDQTETCDFPFTLQNRLYDSCLNFGQDAIALWWCSTYNDDNGRFVGFWAECHLDCRKNTCPLGFRRLWGDTTCYQVILIGLNLGLCYSHNSLLFLSLALIFQQFSPDHPGARVASVDQAESLCRAQGARLWQPKTLPSIDAYLAKEHNGKKRI